MINFSTVSRKRYGLSCINTLSNGRHLVTCSTMESLSLDNNEWKERMNSYFANTADSDIVQPSEPLVEPSKDALNRCPTIYSLGRWVSASFTLSSGNS